MTGSRRLFGTLIEKRLLFLLDLSAGNAPYFMHIQQALRSLFEEQIIQSDAFNLITFGGCKIRSFRPHLVETNAANLQKAWLWIRKRRCGGTRNLLGALRFDISS
ncbi:unnamed protein product [Protopolystoma xenopodis]|uniref:VWFA domain-containing protein n=1 Tax=Protopolystoma xenopodis TaxID=117903 RepID=A0A3S5BIH1_9PLAT|nr:unnamed protein product [Protopolystoma xenopodis]